MAYNVRSGANMGDSSRYKEREAEKSFYTTAEPHQPMHSVTASETFPYFTKVHCQTGEGNFEPSKGISKQAKLGHERVIEIIDDQPFKQEVIIEAQTTIN